MLKFILLFFLSSLALANDCIVIEEDPEAASVWHLWDDDWVRMATLSNETGDAVLTIELDMDGPSTPEVLGWTVPQQYEGRIGLLHYYSGATGTHVSADITRYAVINIKEARLLEIIEASVYLSGTRFHENEDGSYEQEGFSSCSVTELEWLPDRLYYKDHGKTYSIPLF